jgi:hypothetical protein
MHYFAQWIWALECIAKLPAQNYLGQLEWWPSGFAHRRSNISATKETNVPRGLNTAQQMIECFLDISILQIEYSGNIVV